MQKRIFQIIGGLGTLICLALFVNAPSWPTPDKLLVFVTFVFMMFSQAIAVFKRLFPFVVLLLVYESFRGIVPGLNHRVAFMPMVEFDLLLGFGELPTSILQSWLWHGQVQWYDFLFYLAYMMHFILPLGLALIIWKYREQHYWRYIASFLVLSFMGFLTFLVFPAAPPWMAAQAGFIEPIERISSHVWYALGIHDFPSVYNRISPNPVAAVPSLHAAYATLLVIYIYKFFGKKWGAVATTYPFLIYFGTVYQGEHYLIDEIIGSIYAVAAYLLVKWLYKKYFASKLSVDKDKG